MTDNRYGGPRSTSPQMGMIARGTGGWLKGPPPPSWWPRSVGRVRVRALEQDRHVRRVGLGPGKLVLQMVTRWR
jgi:hypothetical protein